MKKVGPFLVRITHILFYLILVVLFLRVIEKHAKLIVSPLPSEYREASVLLTTDALLRGENPYDLDLQPLYTNVYGILYPLIVTPCAAVFGNTLSVHRVVSGFFIFCACILVYVVMHKRGVPIAYALAGVFIFYCSCLFFTTPGARPDSCGLVLFLCSLFIPMLFLFSWGSLAVSILTGVLAFYAKPYFVIGIGYIIIYVFLFISKKKALIAGAITGMTGIIAVLITRFIGECYFNNVIAAHINTTSSNPAFARSQLAMFGMYNLGLVLMLAVLGGELLMRKQWYLWRPNKLLLSGIKQTIHKSFDIRSLQKPFILHRCGFIVFSFLLSLILIYGKFGQHAGTWMVYLMQLLSPFFIPLVTGLIARKRQWHILWVSLFIFNFFMINKNTGLFNQGEPSSQKRTVSQWNRIEQLVMRYDTVFNSPAIVSLLMKHNKRVYDSGQTQYFNHAYVPETVFDFVFIDTGMVKDRYASYIQSLKNAIENKTCDALILTKGRSPLVPESFIEQYYSVADSLPSVMQYTKQSGTLNLWLPLP
ncbi:MAG: hypothetical protein GF384_09105 [Elusimicrobia bacterium]|nr:hypothetical protein [Elusimicrobiota bacterium]MBD3412743.1 hypothetical protein [Elusimicrobiota bacterium]